MNNYFEKISEMISLQDKLNIQTCGKHWTWGLTDKGRKINWKRCIILESTEAMESFNWKHWKDISGSHDEDNIKIEIVDIWHFVMSYLISCYLNYNIWDRIKNLNDLSSEITNVFNKYQFRWYMRDYEDRLESFECLIHDCLIDIYEDDIFALMDLVETFIILMDHNNISLDELYSLYIVKNTLNKFRQDNGYKEWTYVKIWNGLEDNVVAMELMQTVQYAEELYEKLSIKYNEVKKDS